MTTIYRGRIEVEPFRSQAPSSLEVAHAVDYCKGYVLAIHCMVLGWTYHWVASDEEAVAEYDRLFQKCAPIIDADVAFVFAANGHELHSTTTRWYIHSAIVK